MSRGSRRTARVLLTLMPTVVFGGTSVLFLLVRECRDAQRQGTDR